MGADKLTAPVIAETQQAGLQPPKYPRHPKKAVTRVSILHLLVRHIGRAAIKL
jgi:hypothetical protein